MTIETIMTIVMSVVGGGGLVAIINAMFGKKKNKAEVTEINVKTAMELERVAMLRYTEASESLTQAKAQLAEARAEITAVHKELNKAIKSLTDANLQLSEASEELSSVYKELEKEKERYNNNVEYVRDLEKLLTDKDIALPERKNKRAKI
jgi:flagellin-like hook-associated protein FlgL